MCKPNLVIGSILKPQGIRGEIKVKALTDSAEDLKAFKSVIIDGVAYSVLSVRAQGEFAFLGLKGVADRNAAELLRGKDIEVERSLVPAPPEGRFYIVDLIGCKVVTERGSELGEVISVTPARTDIYTISANGKEISFPAADGVIAEVDTENKIITVNNKRFKEVSV